MMTITVENARPVPAPGSRGERAHRARAVSEGAAVTAGAEVALAADRRWWSHLLLGRLNSLPITASSQRELLAALAEEFSAAAEEIHHGTGKKSPV